ncbi:hypothetical protein PALU110988_00790 [Paenibacillus lupini]|uniref:hypothetical protein n=1 Tax=Paenibacillus lupini TaxID=1450204 RepID=UPI00141FC755|nr:hypothetical protein [Paenibacillus lupini]NIK23707.1 hypothetical protein [Paenibacillus lupini]
MSIKKESRPLVKGLDPQKTKKLVFAAVAFIVIGMFGLAFCHDNDIITNGQATAVGWVLSSICFILLMIDTLAQNKSTAIYRMLGSSFFIFFLIYRYLF